MRRLFIYDTHLLSVATPLVPQRLAPNVLHSTGIHAFARQDVDADDVDTEVLDTLMVQPTHLEWAMTKTAPSSLRDKSVEMPDVSWNDVGGLLEVKREMTETLMYPLKCTHSLTKTFSGWPLVDMRYHV